MPKTRIAAQLYTLRDFLKTENDMKETFAKLKKIGFKAVQLSGIGQEVSAVAIKQALDANGLIPCGTHVSLDEMKKDMPKVIANHKLWKCSDTSVPYLPGEYRSAEGFVRAAKEMEAFAKVLAKAKIRLTYHNHSFEFEKYGGKTGLEIIYRSSNPKLVQAEPDTHWITRGGGDPIAWIECLKGRCPLLHLKDMVVVNDQPAFAAVGEGNLNWKGILAAAKKSKVEWYIIEQDTCPRDPFDCLKSSLKFLNKMGLK